MNTNASDAPTRKIPEELIRIRDLLACPRCSAGLEPRSEDLRCTGCDTVYPVHQGIALLVREGTSETWTGETSAATSADYQAQYQDAKRAQRYNEAYRDKLFKRQSTKREFALLRRLLGSQDHCATLLDLPCGGGRLSSQLEPFTDLLIEVDVGVGQLMYASAKPRERAPVWMTASAFHIPLRDDSMDGTVCVRLCHHLPTAEERERLIAELLRVSRRFVIMTFFDYHSVKNRLRRARRFFNRKPPKLTMTVDQVREQARKNGAELVAWPNLFALSSGHRYSLMVKK
jgi:SAM-dependent methyltransferase/uncharacterized protein YbaR (Trm112 family)